MEWLVIWGVAQAAGFVFRPILEDLAKDVAKDAAKSYVGKCFESVFSIIHRNPLTKATGLALKELLELIQNELLDADLDREQLQDWIDGVRRFTQHDDVRSAIATLFLDPDYELDPATFAHAWQGTEVTHNLPDEFSWQRVAKRFARKVADIRQSTGELKETFESLRNAGDSEARRELAGLPPEFDLETYREALVERFGKLSFEMLDTTGVYYSGVRLWSVFVPQSVRECREYYPQLLEIPKEHQRRLMEKREIDAAELAEAEKMQDVRRREYFSQPLRPVLEVCDDSSIRNIVILGDPGSGKSSLLRYLALRWARIEDANLRYTQALPLLIELRDYNRWVCPSGKSFARYLHEAPTWHRLNQQTLNHLLKQPDRVVVLLDGLDEVFDPVQRESVVNDIHRFSNDYKATRIIVTSRVVGYQPQRLRDAEFRHFMLQDLNEEQIGNFLDKWHNVTFDNKEEAQAKRERLRRAIRDSKSIAMLAGNPLLLTMMAILNRHQELPRDRADLYQQATRVLLQQWDTERALEDYPELRGEVDLRAKTAILRSVAYTMQSGPHGLAGNIIVGETLTRLVEKYLHDELHFEQSRAAAGAVVRQLRERNFILCFLGADSYAFVHRTFLEYFCAADFVQRFNVAKTLDMDGLIDLFDKHSRDDDWREVLRLICVQIEDHFVSEIVENLIHSRWIADWDGATPPSALQLAVFCLSETRNPTKLHDTLSCLTEQLNKIFVAYSKTNEREIDVFFFLRDKLSKACQELGRRLASGMDVPFTDISGTSELGHLSTFAWLRCIVPILRDRKWVENLAVNGAKDFRTCALGVIAMTWPDETTRKLLAERAVQDEDGAPRGQALEALSEKWPDETTHKLLTERAVKDENGYPRSVALKALSENWPDETTQKMLTERAVKDENGFPRSVALKALSENWPDETTRKMLTERAVNDDYEHTRGEALEALSAKWPDETTHKLLADRAVKDENGYTRRVALKALSENWPDESTRKLLSERAVQDEHEDPRRAALEALAEKWPDETTRKLLSERARIDGVAASVFGELHSRFGHILFTRDIDRLGPYLDPRKPISRKHIEGAAKEARIAPEQIDPTVCSLSEHLGWDITKGSMAK